MSSYAYRLAAIQHDYLVRMTDRAYALCDDYLGRVMQLFGKSLAQLCVCAVVQRGERIVEYQYFGFAGKDERELFRLLIGVSGVGAATARMMLSSMSSDELRNAILSEDINRIKSIKGIGLKSAQRLILELKDKITKGAGAEQTTIFQTGGNPNLEEATTALVMLGFTKPNLTKALATVLKETPEASLEQLIKAALKKL